MHTSVIMEYVLHSDSTTTLLIDQPEDNIDNEARYAQLTKWIKKQKYNRQIREDCSCFICGRLG